MLHHWLTKLAGVAALGATLTLTPAAWAQRGHSRVGHVGGVSRVGAVRSFNRGGYRNFGGWGGGRLGYGNGGYGLGRYGGFGLYGLGRGYYPWWGYGGYGGYGGSGGYGGYGYGGYPYYVSYGGYPYYGYSSGYYPYSDYSYAYPYTTNNYYGTPTAPAVPTMPVAAANTAEITVDVPANAQVMFDNVPMTQTGAVREYVTPSLTPGQDFSYDIRARWTDPNGVAVDRTRHVIIHAGDHVNVDFVQPTY